MEMTNYENPLEKIVTFGHLVEEHDVMGQRIQMGVLNAGTRRDVLEETSHLEIQARVQAIKLRTLARAILSVNGKRLQYVPKEKDEPITREKLIEQNALTLEKAPQPALDAIYGVYNGMVEKQESIIDDVKKKSPKGGQGQSGKSEATSVSPTSSG